MVEYSWRLIAKVTSSCICNTTLGTQATKQIRTRKAQRKPRNNNLGTGALDLAATDRSALCGMVQPFVSAGKRRPALHGGKVPWDGSCGP
jgi:hypothetical protein